MKSTDIFIHRPVLSSAVSILIFLLGLFAAMKMPLRLLPKIEVPVISVTTTYPGANANVMHGFVTSQIENAIVGVDGVDFITATSTQNSSNIDIHMQLGVDPDVAFTNVMQKVSSVRKDLPKEIDDPTITKSTSSDMPAMMLAFTSDQMTKEQVGDYLRRVVKPKLENIDGVSSANVEGNTLAMRIWLDPKLMAAHNLTADDVANAIEKQNVQAAPGSTKGSYVSFNIETNTDINTADAFNNIVVKNDNGNIIRIKDIGKAELGAETYDIDVEYSGKPTTLIFINALTDANPLDISKKVNKVLPDIKRSLPYDMKTNVVFDSANYINASIHEVLKSIVEATVIVILVIFLFTGALRAVSIPIVTIPLSLVGVCFFMLAMGYSINVFTLLAMVLAIGLVVDDAIVVVENVFRHIEDNVHPFKAAIIGAREIATPIVAMTITLAAVYAPIGFMGGLTGQLFSEFAFTLAGAVIISGIIAFTLSPMMCSRLLVADLGNSPLVMLADKVFFIIKNSYQKILLVSMKKRPWIIAIWLIALISSFYLYTTTQQELSPAEDQGFLQAIGTGTSSSNIDFIKKYSKEMAKVFEKIPEVESYIYVDGVPDRNQVLAFAILDDWSKRSRSAMELQPILQNELDTITGLKIFSLVPSTLPGSDGLPVQFVITSIEDYPALYRASMTIQKLAMQSGLFAYIDSDLKYDMPELNVNVDRDMAASLGVTMEEVANALGLMLGGNKLQQYTMDGLSYELIPQIFRKYRANPDQLNDYYVRTGAGDLVPLGNIVKMDTKVEPHSLNQFQKQNAVTISGIMMPGHTLSEGLTFLKRAVDTNLAKSFNSDYAGESRQFMQEGNRMVVIFSIAIIVIFIVLAIQFESYRDPLIILFGSVPMSLFGALIFLKLGFATINIYTEIGLLTLVGLISKHGILMTKFANELQEHEKLPLQDAIIKSATLRLRPILMTTAAMIFGVIPLILAHGAGSVSRFDIGLVIATGMLIGTLFTLFVVPTLYTFIAKDRIAYMQELEAKGFV